LVWNCLFDAALIDSQALTPIPRPSSVSEFFPEKLLNSVLLTAITALCSDSAPHSSNRISHGFAQAKFLAYRRAQALAAEAATGSLTNS
jgi:hypothetical protein